MGQKIDILTMGCSKNLVDSERLIFSLEKAGYQVNHNPEEVSSGIVVVNTCGFIADAKEESINLILELCERKKQGLLKHLYVMGCLSQRYANDLKSEIPLVDKYFGKFDWEGLVSFLSQDETSFDKVSRKLTTPSHYAYIKISEGCNRSCAYCAIPIMTGKHHSRPQEEILDEMRLLVEKGVKEFQIIAQELTYYGRDLYHKQSIADLVREMAKIEGVGWIRLHYAYPAEFPMELLDVIAENDNVCKYLDIALQHISDGVLARMHRHIGKEDTLSLIREIRRRVPGITLRTTLMVGFPGETDEEFHELKEFVRDVKFERMGAFVYSEEDGTLAAKEYQDNVSEEIKQRRLDEIMSLQQQISLEHNASFKGKVLKVIVDREEGDFFIGRTEYDSPDVDGEVLMEKGAQSLSVGKFYRVEITSSDEFDLYGRAISAY